MPMADRASDCTSQFPAGEEPLYVPAETTGLAEWPDTSKRTPVCADAAAPVSVARLTFKARSVEEPAARSPEELKLVTNRYLRASVSRR